MTQSVNVASTPSATPPNLLAASPRPGALDRPWKVDAAGLLLVGLLTAGGYLAGLGPYLGAKVDKARHDMAMAEARQARDQAKATAESSRNLLALRREATKSINVELQDYSNRHVQVGNVARLAADSELLVEQVAPQAPVPIATIAQVVKVPIVLNGKGSYAQVSEFLARVHDQFRDTAVEGVIIQAEPQTEGTNASFSVKLHWYARPDAPS